MGRSTQTINNILKGEKAITSVTALQLEQAVGVPAHFWRNLESEYRLIIAKDTEAGADTKRYKEISDACYA